jgi:outer membrane protein assembly factor BamB
MMLLLGAPSTVAAADPAAASAAHPKAAAPVPNGSWTVYHHDNAHTGFDSTQPAATSASAGWVTTALDGSILAEPLVFNGLVYAVTLQGSVYAINQADGTVAWSTNVGTPKSWSGQCGNINPLGISGTPVIDTAAGRIYVAENLSADSLWHVFGVDLATHLVVMNTPIPLTLGTGLDWTIQQERGALALANGNVYVPFGGRAGDCGAYHGWIFAVPTNGNPVTNYYETPGQGAGFWTAGGVVVDDSTGKVFETSGNGTASGCNVNTGGTPTYENDAVVRLSATLAHEDAFIPFDWNNNWCGNDEDLGSASMVLINPTLAFQSGKWGTGFLVNPQSLRGMDGQLFPTPKPASYSAVDVCFGSHHDANFGSYAYAAPYVYVSCEHNSRDNIRGGLVALSVNTTAPAFSNCDATCGAPSWHTADITFGSPIVAGGAVWAVDLAGGGLYGFNASNGTQIYHSAGFGVTHFTTPSEAGGQIFVGSGNVIRSFNMTSACSSVTLTAAPPSSTTAGSAVTLTATATGAACTTPQYQFWMRPAAGGWTMLRDYSGTNTFSWTSTTPAGSYYLGVHARDVASTAPFESIASIPYTLTATVCTAVSLSAAPASPQNASTSITVTATGTCPNASPQYEFWALWSGSNTWILQRAYSTVATWTWNSTGAPAGIERFGVWVRDASSAAAYDAVDSITFAVTNQACTAATMSAAPASPQSSGATITVTAVGTCPNASPQYEFWALWQGAGGWIMQTAYSTSPTWTWNSTGAPPGIERFGVWVRDASSSAPYDAVNSILYQVT